MPCQYPSVLQYLRNERVTENKKSTLIRIQQEPTGINHSVFYVNRHFVLDLLQLMAAEEFLLV